MSRGRAEFKVGDLVRKKEGYEFPGEVVSVFATRAGRLRYVVECTVPACAGMLHIYNGSQLEHDREAADHREEVRDRAEAIRRESAP